MGSYLACLSCPHMDSNKAQFSHPWHSKQKACFAKRQCTLHFPAMWQQYPTVPYCAFVWLFHTFSWQCCARSALRHWESWCQPVLSQCRRCRCFWLGGWILWHFLASWRSTSATTSLAIVGLWNYCRLNIALFETILQDEIRFGMTVDVEGYSVVALKCLHVRCAYQVGPNAHQVWPFLFSHFSFLVPLLILCGIVCNP